MNLDGTKKEMEKVLAHLKEEFKALRTNRASSSMLDHVTVEMYGTEMRLRDVANVTTPESRQLLITPFDPQAVGAIAKGIERANLGFNPAVEGNTLRINVPPMTEEIRLRIVKDAKEKAEKAKIGIREARRKGNEGLKQQKASGMIAEDEQKRGEKRIQELTDESCKQVDLLFAEKERDLMAV